MVLNKRAISLLFNPDTAELMGKWYKIDCPNREMSFSQWVEINIKAVLQDREFSK